MFRNLMPYMKVVNRQKYLNIVYLILEYFTQLELSLSNIQLMSIVCLIASEKLSMFE